MKTAALLKRTPTLIVVAFLAYACYSIHASLPDSSAGRTDLAKGLDVMTKDVVHTSANEVRSLTKVMLRDPFRLSLKAADASKPTTAGPDDSEADSLAKIVSDLTLDATFLQGQTRIAIISGHIYHQGQRLIVQGETGNSHAPLIIQSVMAHLVTLSARGMTFELGYPDQLGNRSAIGKVPGPVPSPLGKLGKGVGRNKALGALANQAVTNSRSGRSRRQHGKPAGDSP